MIISKIKGGGGGQERGEEDRKRVERGGKGEKIGALKSIKTPKVAHLVQL
jgi:hypothetical protein